MKTPKNNAHFYINKWMLDYHGTTIEEVFELHPEYKEDNRKFYLDYAVTEKQYERWYKWAFREMKRDNGCSAEMVRRSFTWLDISPSIKEEDEAYFKQDDGEPPQEQV